MGITETMTKKLLSLLLVVGFLGASCGGPSQDTGVVDDYPTEPVTIEVWRPFDEENAYRAAFENYHGRHQNVTLKYRFIEPSRFESEVINALANGTGPDIISIGNDRLPAFADKLVEMPSGFFDGNGLITSLSSQFAPAVSMDAVVDEKVYAIPFSTDSLVLYWNKDIAEKLFNQYLKEGRSFNEDLLLRAPVDWDEVIEATKLMTERNGSVITRAGMAFGVSSNVPLTPDTIAAMMLQRGVEMVSSDQQNANFHLAARDNPNFYPGAAVLDYLKSFADPVSDHYSWNANMPNALDAFIDGKVAMMIGERSMARTIEQQNPTLEFQMAPFPQLANARMIVDYAKYPLEVVTKNADYPQVAWDLLRHISSFTVPLYVSRADRTSPQRNQASTTTVLQRTYVTSGVFALQVPTATSWYKGVDSVAADAVLASALDRVSLQGVSARVSLDQAASALTALLSSNP